eukprot:TRINITY_DN8769_c0_g1_i1.p1 TRINITY_DN8769_c0_g1~~TRINITY_DN8769_c0_g1_i1.p1  ORF type:complete len:728 (+),score=168.36 TRINITY_DN8769_c0_g1_i1:82-2265(+)
MYPGGGPARHASSPSGAMDEATLMAMLSRNTSPLMQSSHAQCSSPPPHAAWGSQGQYLHQFSPPGPAPGGGQPQMQRRVIVRLLPAGQSPLQGDRAYDPPGLGVRCSPLSAGGLSEPCGVTLPAPAAGRRHADSAGSVAGSPATPAYGRHFFSQPPPYAMPLSSPSPDRVSCQDGSPSLHRMCTVSEVERALVPDGSSPLNARQALLSPPAPRHPHAGMPDHRGQRISGCIDMSPYTARTSASCCSPRQPPSLITEGRTPEDLAVRLEAVLGQLLMKLHEHGVCGEVDLGNLGSVLGGNEYAEERRLLRSYTRKQEGSLVKFLQRYPDLFHVDLHTEGKVAVGIQVPPNPLSVECQGRLQAQCGGLYELVSGHGTDIPWLVWRRSGSEHYSDTWLYVQQGQWRGEGSAPCWIISRDSPVAAAAGQRGRALLRSEAHERRLPHRCQWAGATVRPQGQQSMPVLEEAALIGDDVEREPRPWQLEQPPSPPAHANETARRPNRVRQRWRQVKLGKCTREYRAVVEHFAQGRPLPKGVTERPATPDIYADTSKRQFDVEVRQWRRALHSFDGTAPPEAAQIDWYSSDRSPNSDYYSSPEAPSAAPAHRLGGLPAAAPPPSDPRCLGESAPSPQVPFMVGGSHCGGHGLARSAPAAPTDGARDSPLSCVKRPCCGSSPERHGGGSAGMAHTAPVSSSCGTELEGPVARAASQALPITHSGTLEDGGIGPLVG